MIKHFCDRCQQEVKAGALSELQLCFGNDAEDRSIRRTDLCLTCVNEMFDALKVSWYPVIAMDDDNHERIIEVKG